MTRRDKCYLVGRRAEALSDRQKQAAWDRLGVELINLGERDIPKFRDLIGAIRKATIAGKGVE